MGLVRVDDVGAIGVVQDRGGHTLPPNAWTDGLNVRLVGRHAERCQGYSSVMGATTVVPGSVAYASEGSSFFWFYMSAVGGGSKVYVVFDGNHIDISQAGDYTVSAYADWNYTLFQGVPVFNHGNGAPQYWAAFDTVTPQLLADVPNWPAGYTAKVVRAYKNYLIALNVYDGSSQHYHRVLWSDGAAAGTMPASWDVTDAAYEAGHFELSDTNSGAILNGEVLGGNFAIYKSESTWLLRYVGGQLIMATEPVLQASGLLAARCVTPIASPKNRAQVHFVKSNTDLGYFDGQEFTSVLDGKLRCELDNDISVSNYDNCFVFNNPAFDEAWFCYPIEGVADAAMAVVWNYRDNSVVFREAPGVAACLGVVPILNDTPYSSATYTYASQTAQLSRYQDDERLRVAIVDGTNQLIFMLDSGTTYNGEVFEAYLERTGISEIDGDAAQGFVEDRVSRRVVSRVWPRVSGGKVYVNLGGSELAEDDVTWGTAQEFDPDDGIPYVDVVGTDGDPINTRFVAVKFSSTTEEAWVLHGYDLEVMPLGRP